MKEAATRSTASSIGAPYAVVTLFPEPAGRDDLYPKYFLEQRPKLY